jgi:MFS family permease
MRSSTPQTGGVAGRTHALATLRHRDFRLLWLNQVLVMTGLQMQVVALVWHAFQLTGSPFLVGLLGAFRVAPLLVFSLVGGLLADRVDRRRLLAGIQVAYLVVAVALALVELGGLASYAVLAVVTVLVGAGSAFDNPARQALVPRLVPRNELGNALTLTALIRRTAYVLGPGVGGIAIAQLGLGGAYVLTAAVLLASLLPLFPMRPVTVLAAGPGSPLSAVLGGARFLRSDRLLSATISLDFLVALFGSVGAASALFPIFAGEVLGVGPEGLGLMFAMPSVGAVLGALALGAVGPLRRPVLVMIGATLLQGLALVAFSLSPVFLASLALLCVLGLVDVVGEVQRQTVIQLRTPDELRGRVTAISFLFSMSGPSLGQVQLGAIGSLLGVVAAGVAGGAAVGGIVVGFTRATSLRHYLGAGVRIEPRHD